MRLIAIATVAAALAIAALAFAGGGTHAALEGYKYCGKSSLSFTDAKVYGRHYGCRKSRSLFQAWRTKLKKATCDKSNNYCKVSHVRHFRCVYGGDDLLMRLRCTRKGKRVRAYWGG